MARCPCLFSNSRSRPMARSGQRQTARRLGRSPRNRDHGLKSRGAGKTGSLVTKKLRKQRDLGLTPIAILDYDPEKWGSSIYGIRLSGPLSSTNQFEGRANVAIIAIPQ